MISASIGVPGCQLAWSLTDLTPPWRRTPETIVMHHGVGANHHIFDLWLPALLMDYRVLRFDMRGHGASGRPEPSVAIDMDRLSDDMLAVMDAAGVTNAHLVGESIGGTVALHTALRAPERVTTLTVSNGAHIGGSIQSISGWRRMIEDGGMAAWSRFMMEGRFAAGAISNEAYEWFEAQQETADPWTVLAMLHALVGVDLVNRLEDLACPLMILHPDGSPFIAVPVAADLRERTRDSRIHVIGGSRHGLPFSHAALCSGLLRDFLAEIRVRG